MQSINSQRPVSPVVSIAMSVFNGGTQLRYAVDSIIQQSFQDWELLVIDDGSNDGAVDALYEFNDSRICIIQDGENRGLGARLNQAIDLARGRYIARMDHDDLCHPDRLAKQVRYLEQNQNVDLLSTKCISIDDDNQIIGGLPAFLTHSEICQQTWQCIYMPHPTWLGKREWFARNYYASPAPYCCEDQEILLRAHKTSTYATLPDYLLAYRIRSHTPWKKLWRTRLAMCGVQLRAFLKERSYKNVALCIIATAARIISDTVLSLGKVRYMTQLCKAMDDLRVDQQAEWRHILESLRPPDKK